ncbi:hypothetical protein QWY81_10310 [Polaribacter undariae]|uniref:Rad50/SbcC-type AAA domain-containing protein n=2 Tax=Polaribacter sejongensis TaxID=985043 RepID=A0AAJ1QYA6_9FLAO|nr:hypothetical protein [Polaribacter undariae]
MKGDRKVYHEKFHSKINIIRGDNSTGKSSISNFIFFLLGGDFVDWLPEAKSCDYIIGELSINGVAITIKRDLEKNIKKQVMSMRPMHINVSRMEDATKSFTNGWWVYPYSKSGDVETFSQVIFKLLNFPEISTENQETITLNQILRLLYVDQLSSLTALMRNEDFDSPLVRSAIGNLLLGTYNDDLLKLEKDLRINKKEYANIKSQVSAIQDVFTNSNIEFDSDKISKKLESLEEQKLKLNETLKNPDKISENTKSTDIKKELDFLRKILINQKKDYEKVKSNINNLTTELIDGRDFILVLEDKVSDINKSIATRKQFGKLDIEYCPSCLEKLDIIDENHCNLCKREIEDPLNINKFSRMKLEIEMQLKESNILIRQRTNELDKEKNILKKSTKELKDAQTDYDTFIGKSRSSIDTKIDKIIELKSKVSYEIKFLNDLLNLTSSYSEYRIRQSQLKGKIEELNNKIQTYSKQQKISASKAYAKINEYAIEIIRADGNYEEKFKNGFNASIDFRNNSFSLDGRNRFSASSMVVLKNAMRFAIFFASLELDFFRYPKFILCDNIEDKGMVDDRSKNFQKKIVEISEREIFEKIDFQIIFTTSKIESDINIPKYTIGDFYNHKNKTLNLDRLS